MKNVTCSTAAPVCAEDLQSLLREVEGREWEATSGWQFSARFLGFSAFSIGSSLHSRTAKSLGCFGLLYESRMVSLAGLCTDQQIGWEEGKKMPFWLSFSLYETMDLKQKGVIDEIDHSPGSQDLNATRIYSHLFALCPKT